MKILHFLLLIALTIFIEFPAVAADEITIRPELARVLLSAQQKLQNKNPLEALDEIKTAKSIPNITNEELVVIEKIAAVAAINAQEYRQAVEPLQFLLRSSNMPGDAKLAYGESLISVFQKLGDHESMVNESRRYLEAGGNKTNVRLALVQALSLLGKHQEVLNESELRIAYDQSKGTVLSESELRVYGASMKTLKDNAGLYKVFKLLVTHYPKKEYWYDLLVLLQKQPYYSNRYELDVYRLLEATGNLDEQDDYLYMAHLSMNAGFPAETLRIVEVASGDKNTSERALPKALLNLKKAAEKKNLEDEKFVLQMQTSTDDANLQASLAEVLSSRGQYGQAGQAYERSLSNKNINHEQEIRLHYGISLVRAKRWEDARKVLQKIGNDMTAKELAAHWVLLIK
jgi:tetratricopeptide (TPR) repeat protein